MFFSFAFLAWSQGIRQIYLYKSMCVFLFLLHTKQILCKINGFWAMLNKQHSSVYIFQSILRAAEGKQIKQRDVALMIMQFIFDIKCNMSKMTAFGACSPALCWLVWKWKCLWFFVCLSSSNNQLEFWFFFFFRKAASADPREGQLLNHGVFVWVHAISFPLTPVVTV